MHEYAPSWSWLCTNDRTLAQMHVLGSLCVVRGQRPSTPTQGRKVGKVGGKGLGCVCFAHPRTPPESTGPAGVIADTQDRPPEFITRLFRFLYKPGSGWTDRFGFAWPLGEVDAVRS
jgi:hypothetical protein